MTKLSECPVCGEPAEDNETYVICPCCGVYGPSGDPTGEKWNLMCEQNRIGKEALACVPKDHRLVRVGEVVNGEWFVGGQGFASDDNSEFGESGTGYIVIEPITQPPTKESVLGEVSSILKEYVVHNVDIGTREATKIIEQIDAVLEVPHDGDTTTTH